MEIYSSQTIRNAIRSARVLCSEKGVLPSTISMSDIYTRLIFETGRWVERYASDLLYDIKAIDDYIKSPDKVPQANFPIGLRKSGVDGTNFILSRLSDTRQGPCPYVYPAQVYNKILAVSITLDDNNFNFDVKLYDITNSILTIDPSDRTD